MDYRIYCGIDYFDGIQVNESSLGQIDHKLTSFFKILKINLLEQLLLTMLHLDSKPTSSPNEMEEKIDKSLKMVGMSDYKKHSSY